MCEWIYGDYGTRLVTGLSCIDHVLVFMTLCELCVSVCRLWNGISNRIEYQHLHTVVISTHNQYGVCLRHCIYIVYVLRWSKC